MPDAYKKISDYSGLAELTDSTLLLASLSGTTYSLEAQEVKEYIQDNLTVDATPTQGSSNPVQSGGVYTAIATVDAKTVTDTTLSVPNKPADGKATGDAIAEAVSTGIAGSIDTTLAQAGKSAEAKATGDAINAVESQINDTAYALNAEKTGAVVHVDYTAPLPAKKCVVNLPYSEGGYTDACLRVTGRNVCGGADLISDLKARIPSATVDETNGTISFTSTATASDFQPVPFKSNSPYKIVLTLSNTAGSSTGTNIKVVFTDGTEVVLAKTANTNKQTIVYVTPKNKTLAYIGKEEEGGTTTIYANESGIMENMADWEPYVGKTYLVDWSGSVGVIYGGYLDLVNGILHERYDSSGFEVSNDYQISTDIPVSCDGVTITSVSSSSVSIDPVTASVVFRLNIAYWQAHNDERVQTLFDRVISSDLDTWEDIQSVVRAGSAGEYLDIGDTLKVGIDLEPEIGRTGSVHFDGFPEVSDVALFITKVRQFMSGLYPNEPIAQEYSFYVNADDPDHYWRLRGQIAVYSDDLSSWGIDATYVPDLTVEPPVYRDGLLVVDLHYLENDFDVQGIDEDEPVDPDLHHTLSIQAHKIIEYETLPFDPPQYLYSVRASEWPDGLPAGKYSVTLDHGAYGGYTGQDGTYVFTTTQTVPVDGGIRHSTMGAYQSGSASGYNKGQITGGTFITYDADTLTTIETGLVTMEYNASTDTDAVSLGTASGNDPTYKSGDFINFTEHQAIGSNRWSTSWIRQYLNSAGSAFTGSPATIWSRRVAGTFEGFLHRLDPELRAVLCKVSVRHALSKAEGYGSEDVEDYVTLDTYTDLSGLATLNIYEGPVNAQGEVTRTGAYSLWQIWSTNSDRIKYQGTTARRWITSSTASATAIYNLACVDGDGSFKRDYRADYRRGIVPCLHIG